MFAVEDPAFSNAHCIRWTRYVLPTGECCEVSWSGGCVVSGVCDGAPVVSKSVKNFAFGIGSLPYNGRSKNLHSCID